MSKSARVNHLKPLENFLLFYLHFLTEVYLRVIAQSHETGEACIKTMNKKNAKTKSETHTIKHARDFTASHSNWALS